MCRYIIFSLIIIIVFDNELLALEKISRQKRCIVIQKQSGGRADSGEDADDDDYDFKRPAPKVPVSDRLQHNARKKDDVERVPELLKYKKIPNKAMNRRFRIKNRRMTNNFDL